MYVECCFKCRVPLKLSEDVTLYDINLEGPYCDECWNKLSLKMRGEIL